MDDISLKSHETDLIGEWLEKGDKVVGDKICERIQQLIKNFLDKKADGDWMVLYQDPSDNRFWELTYPHGNWHGGGPPRLTVISENEAKKKYKI